MIFFFFVVSVRHRRCSADLIAYWNISRLTLPQTKRGTAISLCFVCMILNALTIIWFFDEFFPVLFQQAYLNWLRTTHFFFFVVSHSISIYLISLSFQLYHFMRCHLIASICGIKIDQFNFVNWLWLNSIINWITCLMAICRILIWILVSNRIESFSAFTLFKWKHKNVW